MAEKPSTFPPGIGENPSLSAEEIEALRAKEGLGQKPAEGETTGDIAELTKRLLEKNLTGDGTEVIIEATGDTPKESTPPPSMSPGRMKLTNRPPDAGIYSDVVRTLLKPQKEDKPGPEEKKNDAYCVEDDKE